MSQPPAIQMKCTCICARMENGMMKGIHHIGMSFGTRNMVSSAKISTALVCKFVSVFTALKFFKFMLTPCMEDLQILLHIPHDWLFSVFESIFNNLARFPLFSEKVVTKYINNKLVSVHETSLHAVYAEQYCNERGGSLVMIIDENMQNEIYMLLTSASIQGNYWIGGSRQDVPGIHTSGWYWISSSKLYADNMWILITL